MIGKNPIRRIRTGRKIRRRWPKLLTPAQKLKQKQLLAEYTKAEKHKDRVFNRMLTGIQAYLEVAKIDLKKKKY